MKQRNQRKASREYKSTYENVWGMASSLGKDGHLSNPIREQAEEDKIEQKSPFYHSSGVFLWSKIVI